MAHIIKMPSFYGAVTWGTALLLYEMRLIQFEEDLFVSTLIFFGVWFLFPVSTFLFSPLYRDVETTRASHPPGDPHFSPAVILLLHGVGILGVGLFLRKMMDLLGGGYWLLAAYTGNFEAIRYESQFADTIGTQLLYFGWLASGFTSYFVVRGRLSRKWLLLPLLQMICSLAYFDRTKPMWILFTTILMGISARRDLKPKEVLRYFLVFLLVGATLFLGIAFLLGKAMTEGDLGKTVLPTFIQGVYYYATSGFGYFNQVIQHETPEGPFGVRFLYPLFNLLSRLGLTRPPPSQILEFYWMPYPTNVGTFLEVFFREGGILFTLIGIIVYTFGLDALGLWFLRSESPLARFAWANACYAAFLGFFIPLISLLPFWMFCLVGATGILLTRPRVDRVSAPVQVPAERKT